MYKLISPALIDHRAEEWGKEMVIDIIGMLKEEYKEIIALLEKAIKNNDFLGEFGIKEKVHYIKSNLYFFVERESDFGIKIQEFENKGKNSDGTNLEETFEYFKSKCLQTFEELDDYIKNF